MYSIINILIYWLDYIQTFFLTGRFPYEFTEHTQLEKKFQINYLNKSWVMLIVLFLRDMFKLYYIDNIIDSDGLNINNLVYRKELNSKDNEGFIGFFDWLRADKSTIVGIRICYFENQSYNELLRHFPYIRPTFDGKCMELLFGGNTYSPDLSGDQDFTNNYVFKSEGGDYLFTFGLDHLTDKELSSLLKYCEVLNEDSLQLGHQ